MVCVKLHKLHVNDSTMTDLAGRDVAREKLVPGTITLIFLAIAGFFWPSRAFFGHRGLFVPNIQVLRSIICVWVQIALKSPPYIVFKQ